MPSRQRVWFCWLAARHVLCSVPSLWMMQCPRDRIQRPVVILISMQSGSICGEVHHRRRYRVYLRSRIAQRVAEHAWSVSMSDDPVRPQTVFLERLCEPCRMRFFEHCSCMAWVEASSLHLVYTRR